MPRTFHSSVAGAEVRGRAYPRQAILCLEDEGACILVEPRTSPRLWGRVTRTVFDGFVRAFRSPAAGHGEARLAVALAGAREALAEMGKQLIETTAPDAAVVVLAVDQRHLFAAVVGAGRVYLHRSGRAERVSSREVVPMGLLTAEPQLIAADLPPGCAIFAGTESAFSAEAVQRSGEMLQRDPALAPAVLANVLTHPAEQGGVGAAAVALRG
jgi:hypothetical protein